MSRDQQRELTRRALIKWGVAAGAALGVSQTRLLEIFDRYAGRGIAEAAEATPLKRSVHIRAVNGGLAWFTLMWPHNAIAADAGNNPNTTWPFAAAQTRTIAGTGGQLTVGPNTAFASLPPDKQITAFMAGSNEAHMDPKTITRSVNGTSLFAIVAALQQASPTLIPAITVDGTELGSAPGAPRAAAVPSGDDIVGLFNSAASRAGGLLSNAADATLYKAHYDAFAQLNRAAERSTQRQAYQTASNAAQFLGTNLAAKLQITQADLDRYGIDGTTRANVRDIGRALIVAVKAFKMGLTNAIALPAMRDDPHGAFADGSAMSVPPMLKKVFDGFMTDLKNTVDDATGQVLADDTVMTICGDTTKSPTNRGGWPDGTPNNSNVIWVYSAGHLKSGWYGGTTRNNVAQGFDAAGNTAAYNGANTARMALASVAYAVAKRDDRAINSFANGITVAGVFGRLKDL